ncbi:adenylate/guanylate cyclase domain-containing protein [Parasphingorhabdus sp.]|uniref:adenylate/guanylate cyclase domain-containing protein n=1 Tax=Parasphingorhabdus sp. TaxID=2709688 RepID=UPI003263CA15
MSLKQLFDEQTERYARACSPGIEESDVARFFAFTQGCIFSGLICLCFLVFVMLYDSIVLGGGKLNYLEWSLVAGFLIPLAPLLQRFGDLVHFAVVAPASTLFTLWITYLLGTGSGLHLTLILGLTNGLLHMGNGPRIQAALAGLLTVGGILICQILFESPSGLVEADETFTNIVFVIVVVAIIGQMVTTFRTLIERIADTEKALAAAHERSEALIRNLVPRAISERLKERPGELIADALPAITVLFADIVGFTSKARNLNPEILVEFLNRMFSRFDMLSTERGLEKIKTIGDAYMVGAGLPDARADHAEAIASLAIAMQHEVARMSEETGEEIQLRMGIHSGPAVAGVVGVTRPFYDVWGDTVNTASRMEHHSEPGRIQVSNATRMLLKDSFELTRRGSIEIKGLGATETWWLHISDPTAATLAKDSDK